jgi:hypothetical protein
VSCDFLKNIGCLIACIEGAEWVVRCDELCIGYMRLYDELYVVLFILLMKFVVGCLRPRTSAFELYLFEMILTYSIVIVVVMCV